MSYFASKTAETISDFASVVHNLVMDVHDTYRPELHYMRGPGPKWRAKHQPWLKMNSEIRWTARVFAGVFCSVVTRLTAPDSGLRITIMCARWTTDQAWRLRGPAARYIALLSLVAMLSGSAYGGSALEERKLPMRFSWVACEPNCRGWVSAIGIVTAETPRDFDDFARDRQLKGETVVLHSSGGSVNKPIALGRRFRDLGMLTTVGLSVLARGERAYVSPEASANPCAFFCYCLASRASCPNKRMSGCIRSGWATVLTMHEQQATAQMIS